MKKILPYIIIVFVLIIAGGIYLDRTSKNNTITNPLSGTAVSDNSSTAPGGKITFTDYGAAPDFKNIDHWLNSDPLTINSLKGKVVLIDFWTYSCINCIRTLPYVTKWYDAYKDKGFVVVGVHTPEFGFEKETSNVADAIKRFNIHYPVAQDNNYGTWEAYSNQYWPAEYLIDQHGHIQYTHFGEGEYDHTENAIRQLLGLNPDATPNNGQDLSKVDSPEMYFGTDRLENLIPSQNVFIKSEHVYKLPEGDIPMNSFALEGSWKFYPDRVVLAPGSESAAKIRLKFSAAKVHLVAGSVGAPIKLNIIVDGKPMGEVTIDELKLYTLFDSSDYGEHTIEISTPVSGNLEVFTFTFG